MFIIVFFFHKINFQIFFIQMTICINIRLSTFDKNLNVLNIFLILRYNNNNNNIIISNMKIIISTIIYWNHILKL